MSSSGLDRVLSAVKSFRTRTATARQAAAGAENLQNWRASHLGSPRLRSGARAFLRTGRVPTGVPGGAEIVEAAASLVNRMFRDEGLVKERLSSRQHGILDDQRRTLIALGLLDGFLYRGGVLTEDEAALARRLSERARRNFVIFQDADRLIERLLSDFSSRVYESSVARVGFIN
jgi:hypothetical protein